MKGQNLEGAGGSLQGSGRARSSPRVPAHSQILEGITTTWGLASKADVQANLADTLTQEGSGRAQPSAFLASALCDSGAVVCVAHIPRTQRYKRSPPELLSLLIQPSVLLPQPHAMYSRPSAICLQPGSTDTVLGKGTTDIN